MAKAIAKAPREYRHVASGPNGGLWLTLGPSAYPLSVDGRPVLFLENNQELYELNAAAAALIAKLIAGVDLDEFLQWHLPAALSGSSSASPAAMERMLIEWSAMGIVDAGAIDRRGAWPPSLFLAAGDVAFSLHFPADDFGSRLAAPYAHLPSIGRATVSVAVMASNSLAFITVDDAVVRIVAREQAASQLHNVLLQLLLESDGLIALHAACIEIGGRAVLFCGAPGAGKSTLSRAVGDNAEQLCGDDVVIFDPKTRRVMGVPFPLTRKENPDQPRNDGDGAGGHDPAEMRADGALVRYFALPNHTAAKWLELGHVIDLARREGDDPRMLPLAKIDALRLLFGEAHAAGGRSDPAIVSGLSAIVANAGTWRLHYGEAVDARPVVVSCLAPE
jgi:hypothetical protein